MFHQDGFSLRMKSSETMVSNRGFAAEEESSSSVATVHRYDAHLRTAMELNNAASSLLDSGNCAGRGPGPVVETLKDAVALLTTPHAVEFRVGDDAEDDENALREYIQNNNNAIMRAEARLLENEVIKQHRAQARRRSFADNVSSSAMSPANDAEKKNDQDAPPPPFVDGGGALIVYARPFRLAALPQGTAVNAEEVSTAVLFNMALAYHLEAAALLSRHQQAGGHAPLPSAGRTRYLLDKALSFYEMCSTMISQLDLSSGVRDDGRSALGPDGLLRLLEALLNNTGQICVEHGERRRGEERFRDLQRVRCARAGRRCHGDVDGREGIYPFDFNVMVVGQMTGAPTA